MELKYCTLYCVQDATIRGAKEDLNVKENKTNTSRKKLKTLTEDSNQPVKRKKKRRRNNKNINSQNNEIPQGCSLQTLIVNARK
jgi:hypothetical protein